MCYASHTGTRRNLAAIRAHGWGLLISRADTNHWHTEGFNHYVLDNGAWSDHQNNRPFDDETFERLIDQLGARARWVVLPDIVAGGLPSLELSLRWTNRCLSACPMALLAVQDGMTENDVAPFLGPAIGLFLGGSTPWKISTMAAWGAFCRRRGVYFHVGRVNTGKRMAMAIAAGADSVDGTSASRFATTTRMLDLASRQTDLLSPP